ncbi:MAG: cation-transporting P-type ATPase [Clostridia bacterium]|nr:cation-transporting P-type ATPase [Clostridia bacterium]
MSKYATTPWHAMEIEELERRLKTDRSRGLGLKISRSRLERLGRNELFHPEPVSTGACIKTIFSDTSLLLLLLICVIALCFSRWNAVIAVLIVLCASTTVTVIAYQKTQQIREAMAGLSAPRVHIIRAGQHLLAESTSIVPGDLLILREGDVIPCDARIVSATDLFVKALYYGTDHALQYTAMGKRACTLDPVDDGTLPSLRENMLTAGSVILGGRAVAFAVATGEDTYLAAFLGPHALSCEVGEVPSVVKMKRYVSRYSLGMCALLLPITLIGLLSGGGELQIFDVFFLALSLGVASMSEQLMVMGRIVAACGLVRAALKQPQEKAAIIKNYASLEQLGHMSELFVYDTIAATDAKMHPHAIYTSDDIYHSGRWSSEAITHFFTTVYLYEKAMRMQAGSALASGEGSPLTAMMQGIKELQENIAFDPVALDIRTLSLAPSDKYTGGVEVALRSRDNVQEQRCILCGTDDLLLERCEAKTVGGETVALDENAKAMLQGIYRKFHVQGSRTLLFASVQNETVVFEGMIVFKQAYDPDLIENLEQLQSSGVRTTLFLSSEDAYDVQQLLNSGWIRKTSEVSYASKIRQNGESLTEVFEHSRVIAGLTDREVESLIGYCHHKKRTVAALSLRWRDAQEHRADLHICCDDHIFQSDVVTERKPTPLENDSQRRNRSGDTAALREADVLVRRCTESGGTLDGVINALYTARAIRKNMVLVLQYLIFTQFLRMTAVLLPLLFGVAAQSAALLVFGGLIIDLGYILILAFHRYDAAELQTVQQDRGYFHSPIKKRPAWICASIATGVLITVLGAILRSCGVASSGAGYEVFVFLSLAITQTMVILFFLQSSSPASSSRFSRITVGTVLFLVLGLVLVVSALPGPAALFGCLGFSWKILLFSLLSIPFFIGSLLLSRLVCPRIKGWIHTFLKEKLFREDI